MCMLNQKLYFSVKNVKENLIQENSEINKQQNKLESYKIAYYKGAWHKKYYETSFLILKLIILIASKFFELSYLVAKRK